MMPEDQTRADTLVDMVFSALEGDDQPLVREVDAMVGFLREWSRNYGEESKPREAMITGMLADAMLLIAFLVVHSNYEPTGSEEYQELWLAGNRRSDTLPRPDR